jgi:hypothetical protein
MLWGSVLISLGAECIWQEEWSEMAVKLFSSSVEPLKLISFNSFLLQYLWRQQAPHHKLNMIWSVVRVSSAIWRDEVCLKSSDASEKSTSFIFRQDEYVTQEIRKIQTASRAWFRVLLDPDDGSNTLLRKVGGLLPDYTDETQASMILGCGHFMYLLFGEDCVLSLII